MLVNKFLCGRTFSILLVICLVVELLGHMVTACLSFEELPDCFLQELHHVTFPLAVYKGFSFSIC